MRDTVILAFARLGFAGLSPVAPGTCGSLLAALLAPWVFMPMSVWWRIIVLIMVFLLGIKACTQAEIILQKTDPSEVVVDELLGQWITFLPFTGLAVWEYAAGFVLFRAFDIFKPWPVRNFERLPRGLGIMADDAVAGVFAMICLAVLHYFFG